MEVIDASSVVVALGSNLGDSSRTISLALDRIKPLSVEGLKVSGLWRSEPKDMNDDSGEFINACVGFHTRLTPVALLRELQRIEVDLGRPNDHGKNVGRAIDLDIIDYNSTQLSLPELTLPHPRMLERLFVLFPLKEVRPEYTELHTGNTIDALIAAAPQMAISRQ